MPCCMNIRQTSLQDLPVSEMSIALLLHAAARKVPVREAEVLLAHCLDVSRAYLYAFPEQRVPSATVEAFREAVAACAAGMPVAYLVGVREFWSLPLRVTRDTLIPRPETELLVETVLEQVKGERAVVLDCGTGAGAIALALASERPQWTLYATDCSAAALQVARGNAKELRLANVQFYQGDWCEGLPVSRFDAIVSNPPYLATEDPHLPSLRYEPQSALVSGKDGLTAIRQLATVAPDYLSPGGMIFLEHGYDQADRVREILAASGFVNVTTTKDLAGNERMTCGLKQ